MARGIDDIDFVSVVVDGHILRQDCDSTFSLQIIAVKDLSAHLLIVAEKVTRGKHLVDQRRFAMIHMSDDGNISYLLHTLLISFAAAKLRVNERRNKF